MWCFRRKKQATSSKGKSNSGEEETLTGPDIEDPEEGCSNRVSEPETATPLPKRHSLLQGLQNQWRRLVGYIWKMKASTVKRGRQLLGCQNSRDTPENQSGYREWKVEDNSAPVENPTIENATEENSIEEPVACNEEKATVTHQGGIKRPYIESGSSITSDEQYLVSMKKAKLDTKHSHTKTSEEGEITTVPLTVDKFTFHHVLGSGCNGLVMLATESIQKERVAVKAIVNKKAMEWKEVIAESKILQMTHKSIFLVHGYGAFHTKTDLYYVMELVTGGTLVDVVEERAPLSLCIVQFLVAEIVCGIQFLHSNGIIHRDLKCENILLTSQGHIKITDFGLSIRITKEGDIDGTTALEKIIGEPYLAAEDWYSLGIIINGLVAIPGPLGMFTTIIDMIDDRDTSEYFNPTIVDLVRGLLCKDKSLRLGIKGNICGHDFFTSINWEEVESGKMTSPLKISTQDATDEHVTSEIPVPHSNEKEDPFLLEHQQFYQNISFVCPAWRAHYHTAPMHPDDSPVCPSIS